MKGYDKDELPVYGPEWISITWGHLQASILRLFVLEEPIASWFDPNVFMGLYT